MQFAKEHGFSTSSRDLSCSRASNVHESDPRELFSFCPVAESQVQKIVKGLPSNKAPAMDKITSRVLKESLPISLPRTF